MTDTTIANIALAQVGGERIGSIEDTTKGARLIKDLLPTIKRKVLESADWGFASKSVELTQKNQTATGATASYQRVASDIRVIGVSIGSTPFQLINSRNMRNWRVQGREIVTTDYSPPTTILVHYIAGDTPSGNYPDSVNLCIATYLAADLALGIQKSKTLYREKLAEAEMLLEQATGNDAVQGSDEDLTLGRLQKSRLSWASQRNAPLVK